MFGKKLLMAIPPLLLTVLLVSLVAAEVTDSSPINSEAFHNTGDIVQVTPEGGNYYYYPSLVPNVRRLPYGVLLRMLLEYVFQDQR